MTGCLSVSAQEKQTEYVFNPHWYIQAQVGGQHTVGEIGFGDLISPNAQLGVGYQFSPVVGLRLGVNAWQSKGGSDIDNRDYNWKWKYVAPALDVTFNLSNLVCGYNPERLFNLGAFLGVGANIAFDNDEAATQQAAINTNTTTTGALQHLWDGTKVNFVGQAGLTGDFRLSDAWSLGLELQANLINDHYNSKHAKNADWYFNALVGVKYNIGTTYTKKVKEVPVLQQQPVEKVVEKVVEKTVEVEKVQPIRRDVFFCISSTKISLAEMQKVRDIAEYMKKYPESKVDITGYADKGTGNAKINAALAEKRAKLVAETLEKEYGISSSRISWSSKGDTEQPYAQQELNRVSICIAE